VVYMSTTRSIQDRQRRIPRRKNPSTPPPRRPIRCLNGIEKSHDPVLAITASASRRRGGSQMKSTPCSSGPRWSTSRACKRLARRRPRRRHAGGSRSRSTTGTATSWSTRCGARESRSPRLLRRRGAVGGRPCTARHDIMTWADLKALASPHVDRSHSMTHARLDEARPTRRGARSSVEAAPRGEAGVRVRHLPIRRAPLRAVGRPSRRRVSRRWAMRGGPGGPFS